MENNEIIILTIMISLILMPIYDVYSQQPIPEWVKNIFEFHLFDKITDEEFVNSLKYLIDKEIIFVSDHEQKIMSALIDKNPSILAKNIQLEILNIFPSKDVINFAAVADIDTNWESLMTLKSIELTNPEVILFAGDLSYSSPQAWFDLSDFLGIDRIFIAIGNHELEDDYVSSDWLLHYGLKKEFYSFDYENVHFVALSMYTDYLPESEQFKFLENDLQYADTSPDIDWIIIFFHEPIYTEAPSSPLIDFRNTVQPLFDMYDVDLVIQGHDHNYIRTSPLQFNNTITDSSISSYVDPEGQIYVTIGVGGAGAHGFAVIQEKTLVFNKGQTGFLNISLLDNGTRLVGEFVTNRIGIVYDTFEICLYDAKMNCSNHNDLLSDTNLSRYVSVKNDLTAANLTGQDLSGMILINTVLRGTNLSYANLSNSDLTQLDLRGVDLRWANLQGANLQGANLHLVSLQGANLQGANLQGANLLDANLRDANLTDLTLGCINHSICD